MKDMMDSDCASGGCNAGMGNRAVAAHVKDLHAAAKMSGSVSSSIKPKSLIHPPGASQSVLKSPKRSHGKSAGQMD